MLETRAASQTLVLGHDGLVWELTPGQLCEATQEMYSISLCWLLALHLHRISGWPLCVVGLPEEAGASGPLWAHAGVLDPQGRFIDVFGASDPLEALECWAPYIDDDVVELDLDTSDITLIELELEHMCGGPWDPQLVAPEHHAHAEATARLVLATLA